MGGKQITQEEFINQLKAKHGGKLLYDKINYVRKKDKVLVGCPVQGHPYFENTPQKLLGGVNAPPQGCKLCGHIRSAKTRSITISSFKERATLIHNGYYNYTLVKNITNRSTKITIICPGHGKFKQTVGAHLSGSGCNDCGITKSADAKFRGFASFLEEATRIHLNGRYEYDDSSYIDMSKKMWIYCTVHKKRFKMRPTVHLRPAGCKSCADLATAAARRKDFNHFIKRAAKVHAPGHYSYHLETFSEMKAETYITCNIHNHTFPQTASGHTSGHGCYDCSLKSRGEKHKIPDSEYLERIKHEWPDLLYDRIEEKTSREDIITVGCSDCGYAKKESYLWLKSGCSNCKSGGIKYNDHGILYFIEINKDGHKMYKIGITNYDVSTRFMPRDYDYITELYSWDFAVIRAGHKIEQNILRKFNSNKVKETAFNWDDFGWISHGETEMLFLTEKEVESCIYQINEASRGICQGKNKHT